MKKQLSFIGFSLVFFAPALALAAEAVVSLDANSISPSVVNVNAGDTVLWTNTSGTNQSVIGNNSTFQSGSMAPGGRFAATFNTSGTYNYYDNAGGSAIVGEIIVSGNPVSTTPVYANPNANYYQTTSASSNATVASLTAQVQALIAQINALQGTTGNSGSGASAYASSGSCPQIGRVLSLGSSGTDVAGLQQFLASNAGYTGGASGYFGSLTQAAVERYQALDNIISYGAPATTGYGVVGPRTAAAIRLACGGSSGGSGNSGGGIVGGFLQVSPVSGSAPLVATVTATVNTAGSCSGATYALNFGDGTQGQVIPVASGNCSQQNQSFQHTYQYGGVYTVTLSAGGHSSTATVTVSGQAGSTAVTSPGNPSEASGSMTAFITSGNAPLATTFYVSCASGLAYDVIFGDGSDLGSNGVAQSSCNGGLQSVAHTYSSPGSYNAQLVVFTRNSLGAVTSQGVAQQGITVNGTSSSSYQPPTLTPNVGGNPLEVSLQYNYDSSGCGATVNWGDGSTSGGSTCTVLSGQLQTFNPTHTYAAAGNYTITLTRGSQTSTVGVTISQ